MAVKPSLRLALLLLTLHLAAAFVIAGTFMDASVRAALALLILLSLSYHLARDVLLLLPGSWVEISFEEGRVSVLSRGGKRFQGAPARSITVSPHFVALGVGWEGHRLPAYRPILPDSLGTGAFRELCVRLKYFQ